MKKGIIFPGMVILFMLVHLAGCAGPEAQRPARAVKPAAVDLDTWLEKEAFPKIADRMRTDSFMKDKPFIIVKARGETVSNRIDALTEDIRERMTAVFLEYPEIRLVRRHPARVIDRPYTLQKERCNRYMEHRMLLTVDIKPLGGAADNLARVNIRAIDRRKDSWIPGFSIHKEVALSPVQSRSLNAPPHPDQYLRGLKYVPFAANQKDEMAAYLARNLTCIALDALGGENVKAFFDVSGLKRKHRDIVWFLRQQLRFRNFIRVTDNRREATLVLRVQARETGPASGLWQFWIAAGDRRGIATYAYFLGGDDGPDSLAGRWKIRNLEDGSVDGFLQIRRARSGRYLGDLYGPDGISYRARGIYINLRDRDVDWRFFDKETETTFRVRGVLLEGGEKMTVQVTSFPSSGGPVNQELVLVE